MLIFCEYEDLNEDSHSRTIFKNNTNMNSHETSDVKEGKPSYYRFSFFNISIAYPETIEQIELENWAKNESRTVSLYLFLALIYF